MARPHRKHPVPSIRKRKNSYYLRWFVDGTNFEMSLKTEDKEYARQICTVAAAAFAGRIEFPEEIANEPAIKRYLLLKSGNSIATAPDIDLIEGYTKHLKAKNDTSIWFSIVHSILKRALAFMGELQNASPRMIQTYLDAIASEKSQATSNRTHTALSGFYRWLRTTGRMPKNVKPMEDIKKYREESPNDGIIIWENNEIPALLKAADTLHDGISIWIAVLAGLRRSEIARLEWDSVTDAYLLVGKSKTGKKRQVPLSKILAERLAKESRKSKRVVPWPVKTYGWMAAARRMMQIHLKKLLPETYKAHPEKFTWNVFRHTFASRHAQQGLSLDIIAAWLGDSPKVCKEHYARYVPKNMRDSRIDAADPEL